MTLPPPVISAILYTSKFLAAEVFSMDIHDTKRILGATRKAELRRAGDAVAVTAVTGPADVLSVAGIGDTELTPKLRQALAGLLNEVEQLKRELGEARARIGYLERLADEDPLMPVANRRAFVRELTRMMSFTQRYGSGASIVYFDIDSLKQINDRHGHAAGDAALLQVARILLENVRDTDVVGRLGGDELGVLLMQTDQALAEQKAAQLAAAIAAHPLPWQGREIRLGVAFGVHSFSGRETVGDAIDAADRAMYAAKRHRADSADIG
jgi:diguanylate cyclase (GGDEF)-like protein